MLKRLCAFAAMLSVFAFAQALGNYTGTWTGASGSGGKSSSLSMAKGCKPRRLLCRIKR